ENFLAALGLCLYKVRGFNCVLRCDAGEVARSGRNVERQLTQRKSFRVGFPSEFTFGNSIQYPLGGLRFLVHLHQNRIYDWHDDSFFSCVALSSWNFTGAAGCAGRVDSCFTGSVAFARDCALSMPRVPPTA